MCETMEEKIWTLFAGIAKTRNWKRREPYINSLVLMRISFVNIISSKEIFLLSVYEASILVEAFQSIFLEKRR